MTESVTTQQQKQFTILLIGDNCLDVYQYGTVDRISPEAPVPIFKYSHKEQRAGMAGNVNNCLKALGCSLNYLHSETSMKTRLIDSRSKQQMIRIDDDVTATPVEFATAIPDVYDAVVISDYNKGTVTYELMEEVIASVKCPVFIDTKKTDLERLQGAWVKINELEYSKIKSECSGLIVTRGAKGADAVYHQYKSPAPKVEVVDVTGAGDTFLAALAYNYLHTKDIKKAMDFANRAAAVAVQHMGCYAPTMEEIE
jgi:D-beta-D-heptose 7-phosphate kinase/D-beta-D-heptose 1-phosphate adenosyltransferase